MNKKWLFYLIPISIFVGVTYSIFFYLDIDKNNSWSTFFSFTSTFGILATIGVYLWQKNDDKKRQCEYEKNLFLIIKIIIKEHIKTLEKYKDSFEKILNNYDSALDNIVTNEIKYHTLIVKTERNGAIKNIEVIYHSEQKHNLEKLNFNPTSLNHEKYVFYINAKSTLEDINFFINNFIFDDTSSLHPSISFDEKMFFYLEYAYIENINKLNEIVSKIDKIYT